MAMLVVALAHESFVWLIRGGDGQMRLFGGYAKSLCVDWLHGDDRYTQNGFWDQVVTFWRHAICVEVEVSGVVFRAFVVLWEQPIVFWRHTESTSIR